MAPRTAFDPRVMLAINMAAQPGVYALMIGSGVSTSVGIPTGWGVVESLVKQVAAAAGGPPIVGNDWEGWWKSNYPDTELGYSQLLEMLGSTPATRRTLLSGFFEATPEEREDGLKVPGPAHAAIASLVARGTVRVIVTTNFDRLIEHALDAAGVSYQVISGDEPVSGMEPLVHSGATIIKLHGDFMSMDQKNTVVELSEYGQNTRTLLDRIFDEYGLLVAGWSGEWDHALVGALEGRANRRYPLVWTARGTAGAIPRRLTSGLGDVLLEGVTADEFFPDVLRRVEAVESMAETEPSLDIKLARLRRALPDPVRHLEVREIFERELTELRTWASDRKHPGTGMSMAEKRNEISAITRRWHSLLQLYSQGILLDRDRQHTDLWVWVLQQALNARSDHWGSLDWWGRLAHWPAYLMLRVGIMSALEARHEDVIVRLCGDPRWSAPYIDAGNEAPAHQVLHNQRVLDHDTWKRIQTEVDGRPWSWPVSHLARAELRPFAEELFGAAGTQRERGLDRMEYRLALASELIRPTNAWFHHAAGGEYIAEDRFTPALGLQAVEDFALHGDVSVWRESANLPPGETFESLLEAMNARLLSMAGSHS